MKESGVNVCGVAELDEKLKAGECVLVDVREEQELASEKIAGCVHAPMSALEKSAGEIGRDKAVYLICRTGARSRDAAARFTRMGFRSVRVVEGGIKEWIESGRPVIRGRSTVWDLERQVRFAAASLVLLGIGLSRVLHPAYIFLAVFVCAGLIFSAVTDTCGMAMLLARMPWNRKR